MSYEKDAHVMKQISSTVMPNRVEKGTSKKEEENPATNAGLSCNFAGFSLLHLFPFLSCLMLQCMHGKQFYGMVSTFNLQPPCMKTAEGLPAQFLHLKFGIWFLNLFLFNNLSLIGANLLLLSTISCPSVIWH